MVRDKTILRWNLAKPYTIASRVLGCLVYSDAHFLLAHVYAAAQMWLLGRILPLVIGDLVPRGNAKWENFIAMMKIVDLLFAPTITEELLGYLSQIIEGHHHSFTTLYPGESVIPKMHFMIHMPRLIKKQVTQYSAYDKMAGQNVLSSIILTGDSGRPDYCMVYIQMGNFARIFRWPAVTFSSELLLTVSAVLTS